MEGEERSILQTRESGGDKGESKLLNSFMNGSRDQGDLMGKEARLPCS